MLRVLIADDHEVVRHGVRQIVESQPGWEVVAEAADGREAFDLAVATQPDVCILDVSLPLQSGLIVARRLRAHAPQIRILMFSMHDEDDTVREAVAAGARGYVLKTESDRELKEGVAAVAARRPYFSPTVADTVMAAASGDAKPSKLDSFTERELEVIQLVAEGNANKQIARLLAISVKTVECHRSSALRKAGVHTAAELVRFAIKHNLIRL
jgi:DNA-binding NarL/FixJ family response regulator